MNLIKILKVFNKLLKTPKIF